MKRKIIAVASMLLLVFCMVTQTNAQGWNGQPFDGKLISEYPVPFSGRHYLLNNQWRGFNNTYGFNNQQFSQNFGTATTPTISYTANGIQVFRDGFCQELQINGRINNAETFIVEIAVTCVRSIDSSTSSTKVWEKIFQFKTGSTDTRILNYTIEEAVQKNDEIVISMRKREGSATTRYFYYNGNLVFI